MPGMRNVLWLYERFGAVCGRPRIANPMMSVPLLPIVEAL